MSADDMLHDYSGNSGIDGLPARRSLPIQELARQPDVSSTEHQPASRHTRTGPPRLRGSRALNAMLLLLILIIAGIGGGLYYLDRTHTGKIYPNVSVQGLALGEMTPQEAEAKLRARYEPFLRRPVTLTFGDRTWRPTAEELGIRMDFDGAIMSAYSAGRDNGLIANVRQVAAIWQNGLELPIHVTFDQNKMQRRLQQIAAELDQEPVDAQLRLNKTVITTTPAQIGRQVLADQTVQELTDALATFTPQTIAVRTRDLPPRLSDAEVADAKQKLENMLQGPLTLTVEKQQYIWQPEDIALMIDIARVLQNSSTDRISIAINNYQLNRRIQTIVDETGRGSVNPRVDWNNGNLKIIRPGEAGIRVDEDAARQMILTSIGGSERTIALPVLEIEPQVSEANLQTLGIKELVSVGQSDFTGSAEYRVQNIGVGMNILHGILLAPGEEFSFNDNIGTIDAKNGFVEGYAIIQNRTQLEFGGGICQDSTTMFRAAFWAGLPITERWGHSFYISWYDKYALGPLGNGPGMDATIFTGGPDLKFANDTGRWLLIQATSNAETGIAEIAFYGTKPNRSVELTHKIYDRVPPIWTPAYIPDLKQPRGSLKRTDTARGGMTIDVYRIVTENGVKQEPELFRTKFKAWSDKYLINPADLGPDGRPIWLSAPAPVTDPAPQPPPPADQAAPPPPPGAVTEQPPAEAPAQPEPASDDDDDD